MTRVFSHRSMDRSDTTSIRDDHRALTSSNRLGKDALFNKVQVNPKLMARTTSQSKAAKIKVSAQYEDDADQLF